MIYQENIHQWLYSIFLEQEIVHFMQKYQLHKDTFFQIILS